MDSRCLIVTPDIMRQIISTKEAVLKDNEAKTPKTAKFNEDGEEELIKVHTVKSSSLLKFLLCESAKKVAAVITSPFSSNKLAIPKPPASTTESANVSKDLICWDEDSKSKPETFQQNEIKSIEEKNEAKIIESREESEKKFPDIQANITGNNLCYILVRKLSML